MKYRSSFKVFSQLTGLALSLVPYILFAPISVAFAKTLYLERIHFKNAPSRLKHSQLAKLFQFYQKLFDVGYRLGSVVDTLLCGIAQPLFFLSEKLFSKTKTEKFVRSIAAHAHAINEKIEKVLSSGFSSYLPAFITIGALITAPLLGALLMSSYSFFKLYPSLQSRKFKTSSRLKKPSIHREEISAVNIDLLCFPGKYPKDNLLRKSQEVIETIKDDYHSDYAILTPVSFRKKTDNPISEMSPSEKQAYKIGQAYRRGIMDTGREFLYQKGQSDSYREVIEKKKPSQKAKGPSTYYSLYPFQEKGTVKNPPKHEINARRKLFF